MIIIADKAGQKTNRFSLPSNINIDCKFLAKTLLPSLVMMIVSFYGYSQSCTLAVTLSTPDSVICLGSNVTLTTKVSGGTAPFRYSWSTGETTPAIVINKAGTYKVTVGDQTAGCVPVTKSITVTNMQPPAAPTAPGIFVCHNTPAMLVATAPGGLYQWFDAPNGGNFLASGDTLITPPIKATTTFYVQTTVSGCTSARTPVTVKLAATPSVSGSVICAYNHAVLKATGADSYVWYDKPQGGTILGTGATLVTPVLAVTTTFYLEATTNGCTADRIAEVATVMQQIPPPVAANVSVCSGNPANLHADVPVGIISWYAQPSGGVPLISSADFTTPALTGPATYYAEVALGNCVSLRTAVSITINPIPISPATQADSVCYNSSIVLTASTNPTGTYQWYDAPVAGNLLATGATFTTPALKYSITYYVQHSNATCASERAAVRVLVKPAIKFPSVSHPLICAGSSVTLKATAPGGIYQWYDALTGGNLLATGAEFTTPILFTSQTFYVQTTVSGCTSERVAVPVSILPPVAAPTVKNETTCSGDVATLTASGSNDGYAWYDKAAGGNLLKLGPVFVTPSLMQTTTYYVEATAVYGCEGVRVPVTVTVNKVPGAPAVTDPAPLCPGSSVTFKASAEGGKIQWFDDNNKLVGAGEIFTTQPLLSSTSYFVQHVTGTCVSQRVKITANIIKVPYPQFKYGSGTLCGLTVNLKPTILDPSGGTFSASPQGIVFVDQHTGEINTAASVPGRYTITFTGNGTCPGLTTANINITHHPNGQFYYAKSYCTNGPNPEPIFPAGSSAGTFTSSPAGLVFVNEATGEINLKASKPGLYTITNSMSLTGCGARDKNSTITIYEPVVINAGPDQTVNEGQPVQLHGTVSEGRGRWSGGKGSFSNVFAPDATYIPAAGETIDTLTFSSNDQDAHCGPQYDEMVITIRKGPAANEVCMGGTLLLSAPSVKLGDTYQWYSAPTGGSLLVSGAHFLTPPISKTTTYYLQTTDNGVMADRTPVPVIVNSSLTAPVVKPVTKICGVNAATLTASGSPGGYEWYDAPVGGNLLSLTSTLTTPVLNANTSYYVQSSFNGCLSPRVKADVLITPVPNITSALLGIACSSIPQSYAITADLPMTSFVWSREKVKGISNAALANQTSANITEALINTSKNPVSVIYKITAANGTCISDEFDYTVTVYPSSTITSPDSIMVCAVAPDNYNFTFSVPSTTISWSRAAVKGLGNQPVTGQAATNIQEFLFNGTALPLHVLYTVTEKTAVCDSPPFNLIVTVNPVVYVNSSSSGEACNEVPQDYTITSNVAVATFTWSRAKVANIRNAAVSAVHSNKITEALVNTGSSPVIVTYLITPSAYGCNGNTFRYSVIVYPLMAAPSARSNSPVCLYSTIQLNTPTINNATYVWTGPNGFTSPLQSPLIKNATLADTGKYSLNIIVNGCTSPAGTVDVKVDQMPVTNAGPDQTVCKTIAGIKLAGVVSGGTITGMWSTGGSGTFSPAANDLNAVYIPSAEDRTKDLITLTLSSTSKDDCHISTSDMKIIYGRYPGADAGADMDVCSQSATADLSGKIFTGGSAVWSTSGTGTFRPSANILNPTYVGSTEDVKNGSVKLTLRQTSPDSCYLPTDEMVVKFIPPLAVNAGGTRFVLIGNTITLYPSVADENVHYLWSPNSDIDNDTLKNPVITGKFDRTYTLTITDSRGCQTQDQTFIKVSPPVKVPNTFTPNGDGVNDVWDIEGMIAYVKASIDIFDRAGQRVYHSIGYNKSWDGTFNGKNLPVGTYYYVIDTNQNQQVLSGPVTIIR